MTSPTSDPLPPPPAYIARSASIRSTTSSQSQSATSVSSSSVSTQGQPQTTDQQEERPRRSSISKSIYQGYEDDHPSTDAPPPLPPLPTDMAVSACIHFEDDAHVNQHPSAAHYYSRPSSPVLGPSSGSNSPVPVTTSTILEDFHHSHQNHYLVPLPPAQHSSTSASSSPFAFFANSIALATSSSSAASSPMTGGEHTNGGGSSSSHNQSTSHATHHFPTSSSSSKTLRIELAQPEVVLMAGQVTTLEGVLYVNVHKPTKVKTLQLEFSGRSSVTWIDGKMQQKVGKDNNRLVGVSDSSNVGYCAAGDSGWSNSGGSNSSGNSSSGGGGDGNLFSRPTRRGTKFLFSSKDLVAFSDTHYSQLPSSSSSSSTSTSCPSSSLAHTAKRNRQIIDNAYSPATRHTTAPHIEHTWELITHQHKQPSEQLQPGQHAYPFALELPDTLPETLTTTHGKVAYRLTATLTKPGFSLHSSTITMPVTILRRYPSYSARTYQRGGRAVSRPEDKVQYKIVVPQTRVPHSTKVPLQVSITAPTPRIQVNVLQVGLWERVVYRADGRRRVDMRLVKIQKSEGWPQQPPRDPSTDPNGSHEATTWNKVLLFDMPQMGGTDLTHCNPSADNGLMKVTHLLRFSILGLEGTKRFRVESEVDIKVLAFEDEVMHPAIMTDDGSMALFSTDGDPASGAFDNELPSYLTSFSTPRVSFDAERDIDPTTLAAAGDDDLLRTMLAGIHLPTYAESEEDNSRATSRNVSRGVSRSTSRAASRAHSPERSSSAASFGINGTSSLSTTSAQQHQQHDTLSPSNHQHHSSISSIHSNNGANGNQDGSGLLSPHHLQPHQRSSSPLRSAV
ncbi:hypothetical protein BGW42_004337 [Actinomortierella wolfii]|nr:hypothetical protein BGW42_004337 [Actinomortierella wolfii]